jgi:hypothetical protein
MKKNILIIAAFILPFIAGAQKSEYAFIRYKYMFGYYDMSYGTKENKAKIAAAKISGYEQSLNNGKKEYITAKSGYDINGNTLSYSFYKKNGKIRRQYTYTYSSENKILSEKFIRGKDKEIKKINMSYDTLGNTVGEEYFKKGELKAKTISKFDSTRVLVSYFYKNGSPDFKRKWIYTYYPDKSKKSSVIYKADGKVKYTWNYECKPEGALQSKHKDTTDICKKEETDSLGNKVVTTRRFNEKGKAYKVISTFNKENKVIKYVAYDSKDMISYSYKYDPKSLHMLETIYYSRGKEKYKYLYEYESNDNLSGTTTYKKGKLINHSVYTYNSQNFVTSITYYFKNDKKKETYNYKYFYL